MRACKTTPLPPMEAIEVALDAVLAAVISAKGIEPEPMRCLEREDSHLRMARREIEAGATLTGENSPSWETARSPPFEI